MPRSLPVCAVIVFWFAFWTWRGLQTYFSNDDIMNLYWAWTVPLPKLVLANLVPFTAVYRPLGAAVYRALFGLFGLDPLPLRLLCYTLLLVNTGLTYRLAKHITGSREVAILAAFTVSFHPRLADLYLNSGTLYDLLCAVFLLATLLFYRQVRVTGAPWQIQQWLILYALVTAALNSKEMAFSLPLLLIADEAVYDRPASLRIRDLWQWCRQDVEPSGSRQRSLP